ncbi:MAG: hypothetical protein WCO93_00695 [bacterium]
MNDILIDMEAKEQWINETMESLNGLNRARADQSLLHDLLGRIDRNERKTVTLRTGTLMRIAAGIVILVALNIISILFYDHLNSSEQTNRKLVATEYFSYLDTIKY